MSSPRNARRSAPRIAGLTTLAVLAGVAVGFGGAYIVQGPPSGILPPAVTTTAAPPVVDRAAAPSPPAVPPVTFTVVAAGDVLPHAPVVSSATADGVIDFSRLMTDVTPYVTGADLALCHMEVPVAPAGTSPSGYPMFAAPAQIVPSLASAGWDGCSTASNHSVDRGAAGIAATLEALDAAGMGATGTARTEQESTTTQMYVVHGAAADVTVANISFAYGLNGLPKPSGQPWSVNTFNADAADAAPIIAAAQFARDQGADVVIASVHCCVEYQTAPTAAQRSIAEQVAASGLVDLYIGHHAHVPQPIEKLEGGTKNEGMWVAFGLGNFVSNQDTRCCTAETTSGVLLTATFSVADDGGVDVGVEWTATTVDTQSRHTMHVLTDIPGGAGTLSAAEVDARHARVAAAVGAQAPERVTPVAPLSFGVDTVLRSTAPN